MERTGGEKVWDGKEKEVKKTRRDRGRERKRKRERRSIYKIPVTK